MSLLRNLETHGHVLEALYHINEGDMHLQLGRYIYASRALADALNKLQSEWFFARKKPDGEMGAFREMLVDAISPHDRHAIASSSQVDLLANLEPTIQSHKALLSGGYRPGVPITPQLKRDSERDHTRLRQSIAEYRLGPTIDDLANTAIKRIADLLYVVRSNVAHGEKTPHGPDHGKKARDAIVCRTIVPVQRLLLENLLEYPAKKLVTYGSLAPEGSNYGVVADITGSWGDVRIRGTVTHTTQGLANFQWSEEQGDIPAKLLTSDLLPENWQRIDDFEGALYARRLILARQPNVMLVANAYVGTAIE